MKPMLLAAVASGALLAACSPDAEPGSANLSFDQSSADAAVAQMGLGGIDTADVSFASANFENGDYVMTDVVIRDISAALSSDQDDLPEGKTLSNNVEVDPDELHIGRLVLETPQLNADGQVLMAGIQLTDLRLVDTDDDSEARLARFSLNDPNAALSTDIARVFMGEEFEEHDWSDYAFSSFVLEDFVATDPGDDDPAEVSFDRFEISGVNEGAEGRFLFSGLEITGSENGDLTTVRLGELRLDGFRSDIYAQMADAMKDGDDNAFMSAYSANFMRNPYDSYDRFALRDLLIEADGIHIALDAITGQVERRGDDYHATQNLGSLIFRADSSGNGAQLAQGLGMLGYDQIEMSFATTSVYDEAADRVYTTGDNYLEIRDGLRVEFESDMSGYSAYLTEMAQLEVEAGDTEGQFAAMDPLVINRFSMRIEDLSLLDRALEAGAATQGVEKEQMRMQAGLLVGMGMMSAPPEVPRPLLTQVSTALTNFINQGGSMTITMSPEAPVSVGELMDQADAGTVDIDALGLTVDAEAPQ